MKQFQLIGDKELPTLFKVVMEENHDNLKETVNDLEFIDRALTLQKSQSLMSRKSPSFKKQLDALLEFHATGEKPQLHGKNYKR